jgi:hypothetical protein
MTSLPATLAYPARLHLFRLRKKWQRLRRAFLYAAGRLSKDDAQDIMLDCRGAAGWHPLTILSVEDTLARAREIFADHPALPELIAWACARVEQKWSGCGDDLWEAQKWAIELAQDYARQLNIALVDCADSEDTPDPTGPAHA